MSNDYLFQNQMPLLLFAKMVKQLPGFAEYQRQTSRKIPVLTLERIG